MVHPAFRKRTGYHPIPPSLHFWQEKIPQLRPQKLEELPGGGTDDREIFPWKDCEKMESRVMIIEETDLFFGCSVSSSPKLKSKLMIC